jgi:DNA-3-methyladenine glycosylase
VTEEEGRPAAVLIRALAPVDGIPLMQSRRNGNGREIAAPASCRGPGNLTRALGITLAQNTFDLTRGDLVIEDRGLPVAGRVRRGPRIGINVALDRPWRRWIADHPCVSR